MQVRSLVDIGLLTQEFADFGKMRVSILTKFVVYFNLCEESKYLSDLTSPIFIELVK